TEQEWIAKYLVQKQVAFCVNQKDFALEKTLQKASGFEYKQVSGLKNSNLPLLINSLLKGSAGKI
ncbi:MAG: hypothetical protein ACXWWD_02290, partial [Chitinophagaceae bacterium]